MTQLTKMMDSLLEGEIEDPDLLECFFLEALYCSLGSSLLDEGRIRFDECIKNLSSMPTAETEGNWARPGELPGRNREPLSGAEEMNRLFLVPACAGWQTVWFGGLGDMTTTAFETSSVLPTPAGQPPDATASGGCSSDAILDPYAPAVSQLSTLDKHLGFPVLSRGSPICLIDQQEDSL